MKLKLYFRLKASTSISTQYFVRSTGFTLMTVLHHIPAPSYLLKVRQKQYNTWKFSIWMLFTELQRFSFMSFQLWTFNNIRDGSKVVLLLNPLPCLENTFIYTWSHIRVHAALKIFSIIFSLKEKRSVLILRTRIFLR